eukprot:352841-Chlamydomonas_euryale.AAC.3
MPLNDGQVREKRKWTGRESTGASWGADTRQAARERPFWPKAARLLPLRNARDRVARLPCVSASRARSLSHAEGLRRPAPCTGHVRTASALASAGHVRTASALASAAAAPAATHACGLSTTPTEGASAACLKSSTSAACSALAMPAARASEGVQAHSPGGAVAAHAASSWSDASTWPNAATLRSASLPLSTLGPPMPSPPPRALPSGARCAPWLRAVAAAAASAECGCASATAVRIAKASPIGSSAFGRLRVHPSVALPVMARSAASAAATVCARYGARRRTSAARLPHSCGAGSSSAMTSRRRTACDSSALRRYGARATGVPRSAWVFAGTALWHGGGAAAKGCRGPQAGVRERQGYHTCSQHRVQP